MNIHLLHVNDIHSQIENHMRLGALLRRLRTELQSRGEPVLTFDIGDTIDRVRPEAEATRGVLNAALLGALGVDGWVFGNNEGLTVPVASWPQLAARAQTTVFGTNLRHDDGTALSGFVDVKVYQANGVRVGVFGVTPNYERPYAVLGIRALDPFAAAAAATDSLRAQGCEVVVALSHLGLFADRTLAAQVPEIDVILGGHSHQFMTAAETVGQTAIFQAGKHGFAFGHTTVEFDSVARRIQRVTSEPLAVDVHGPLDQQMLSTYRGYLPDIAGHLKASVTTLDQPLQVLFDRETALSNLLVDALFAAYPCDLGLIMAGALTASLRAGEVLVEHVHGACSTPTRPILISLTGRDIYHIVERSVLPECYDRKGFGFGFRGSVVGFLALANAAAVLERDQVGGRRLVSLKVNGQPLVPDRWYRVVTCEYLWLAPVFPEFHGGRDVEFEVPLVRDVLRDAMRNRDQITAAHTNRYSEVVAQTEVDQEHH